MLFFLYLTYIYNGDMMNKIGNYLNNNDYKMIIDDNSIYIVNYKKLLSLEEDYISVITNNKKIGITGRNLVLKKIVEEELLIKGKIKKIEVLDEQ